MYSSLYPNTNDLISIIAIRIVIYQLQYQAKAANNNVTGSLILAGLAYSIIATFLRISLCLAASDVIGVVRLFTIYHSAQQVLLLQNSVSDIWAISDRKTYLPRNAVNDSVYTRCEDVVKNQQQKTNHIINVVSRYDPKQGIHVSVRMIKVLIRDTRIHS